MWMIVRYLISFPYETVRVMDCVKDHDDLSSWMLSNRRSGSGKDEKDGIFVHSDGQKTTLYPE